MPRKIVQIVTSAHALDGVIEENLYALDSTGSIWTWCDDSRDYTAGWMEMDLPWDCKREKKPVAGR